MHEKSFGGWAPPGPAGGANSCARSALSLDLRDGKGERKTGWKGGIGRKGNGEGGDEKGGEWKGKR